MEKAFVYLYVGLMATSGVMCAASIFVGGLQLLGFIFGA